MASTRQSQALEALRAQVESAQAKALANPLRSASIEDLRALTEGHTLGVNRSGWVNPYPAGDPRALLLEYQFANFHDRSRFKATLAARQTGKDFTSEGEVVEDCFQRPGTDWMIGAPSERQALDSLDQAKLWAEAFDMVVADFKEHREGGSETLLKSAELVFSNGSRARAVPGKPDTVRGRSANVLLTEFDFFENPIATWRAILPSITNPLRGGEKRVRICTTPNGQGGAMHKIWTKADGRMKWSRHLVTIYHAVLMGLPVDIAQLREAMDDQDGWAQEYECRFLDGSSILLPYEIIALAESIDATECIDASFWDVRDGNPVVCGIDFGRTNDPTICWTLELVGGLGLTREVLVLRDMPTPQQEEILSSRIGRASHVSFDYTGPGIGLGDYLVARHGKWAPEEHEFGKIELCTFTPALKREMFPKLRRAFEAPTTLRIPISIAVREDLHQMRQIVSNGQYSYSAPHTAEGHSDRCTALALAHRARARAGIASFFTPAPFTRRGPRAAGRRDRSCNV
jgi:phage FluMu gp28-like protein